jgi:glutamate N-acetyltransferase/amino-acid N-acetyltransferase
MDQMLLGLPKVAQALAESDAHGTLAAEAIRTTDTFTKEGALAVTLPHSGTQIRLGGMTKGSGMIHPNMATMLGFITTDAAISNSVLQQALAHVTQASFNQISVDGDMSTNDMVVVLANGCANNPTIDSLDHPDFPAFLAALEALAIHLAKQIAQDGEGATKLLEARVNEAATIAEARTLAKAIICSSLVKSAFFGQSANWGRILSSMGSTGADFNPQQVTMQLTGSAGSVRFFNAGQPVAFDAALAKQLLAEASLTIEVFLGQGTASGTAWGCDLTYDYVKINADYMT